MSTSMPCLSLASFVYEEIVVTNPRTVFFLSFAKQELLTPTNQLCLSEAQVSKQHLFEVFLYLTRMTGGSVYQIMLEPMVQEEQQTKLNPYLRYEMSNGVLFLFVLPRCESLDGTPSDVQAMNCKIQKKLSHAENSDDSEAHYLAAQADKERNDVARLNERAAEVLNQMRELGPAKHTLVNVIKKLICHTMGITTFNSLLYKGHGEVLYPHINFATNYFKHTGGSMMPNAPRGKQNFEPGMTLPPHFGVRYLVDIAAKYFLYQNESLLEAHKAVYDCNADDDLPAGVCEAAIARTLWSFHVSNLTACPILQAFISNTADGPIVDLLNSFACRPPYDTTFVLKASPKILIFNLLMTDLFPSLYKQIHLPCFRAFTEEELCSFTAQQRKALAECNFKTWVHLTVSTPRKSLLDDTVLKDNFKINFPHLATIRDILKAFCTDFSNPSTHYMLLYTLLNHQHIMGTPRDFHNYMKIFLSKIREAHYVRGMCLRTNKALTITSVECPLKVSYRRYMENMFVRHFGITRLSHAISAYHYIMSNAAPRWRRSRLMLLNCSRPGEGKTFANNVLSTLFKNARLLEVLGNMSPASLKYTPVPQMMKTLILDDVGFSDASLKTSKNESSMIASSFKSLLDTGCVVSITADKQEANKNVKSRHVSTSYLAVYNTGFIWNTNSMNIFSSAVIDRSILFETVGNHMKSFEKPKIDYYSTEEDTVAHTCETNKLTKATEITLFRTYIFQVSTSMLFPDAFRPLPQHDMLIMAACYRYHTQFATMACTDSVSSSKARNLDAIRDLAFQKACFLATMYVYDLWIPPWTKCTKNEKEMGNNRLEALEMLGWPQLNLECIMAFQLVYPSCLLEAIPMVLGQDSVAPLKLLKHIINACIAQNSTSAVEFDKEHECVILTFTEELNLPMPLNSELGRNCLTSLQNVRVPVAFGDRVQHSLIQEFKTIHVPGRRASFRLVISGEVLLSVIFVFYEQQFVKLYETMLPRVRNFAEQPMRVEMSGEAISPTEVFIINTLMLCPRLQVNYMPTLNVIYMGRDTGLRIYAMRDELKKADGNFEVDPLYRVINSEWKVRFGNDDSSEAEDAIFDVLTVYEHGAINLSLLSASFKLVRFTDVEYSRYVFAKQFSSFTRSLNLFDAGALITSTDVSDKAMDPVSLPSTQTLTKLHETACVEKTRDGLYTLVHDWEYIVAARTNYLYVNKQEPTDEEDLLAFAQHLKNHKYAHTFTNHKNTDENLWSCRTQTPCSEAFGRYYGQTVRPVDLSMLQLKTNEMLLPLHQDPPSPDQSDSHRSFAISVPTKRPHPKTTKNVKRVKKLLDSIVE
ncbi:ORF111 [Ranid herpesvirus 2]|uniref:ORF111 n=1 Tax=Ranid herpesvirus 2 TaxID=389214 RepID=Q14VZ5_9VIRU|nr:ORF111 [Ranid herpesvirus 2]ABG25577.1 ORF111 [Ranid herpesvirus 2]